MPDSPVITDVRAAVYDIPTDAPEADGTLAWDHTTMVLVTAVAGGREGIGWSYAAGAAADLVTHLLKPVAVGRPAFGVPAVAEDLARALRNAGRPGVGATALSALDIALWDLKARLLSLPVADLLGRAHMAVPVYGSGGFTSYDERQTREQLTAWVDGDGIPRVKIKIGKSWGGDQRRDLARVALAREVIGPETQLYVDANGGYTAAQAIRMARAMDDYGVTWFEEPVSSRRPGRAGRGPPPGPAGRGGGRVLLVAGRRGHADRRRAVDCLQTHVTRCGGITDFVRGSALAAAHNLQVSAYCAPSLHAHVGAAVPNLRHLRVLPRPSAHRGDAVRRGAQPARRLSSPRTPQRQGWAWRCGRPRRSATGPPDQVPSAPRSGR